MSQDLVKTKNSFFLFLLFLIVVPIIIYFYFLKWKTDTIYGDDLLMFRDVTGTNSFIERLNWHVAFQKYRPVHGLSMQMIIDWFGKNINAYYVFNVAIHTINTFIFALLINLFLKSPVLSFAFSLIFAVSRFTFFNISQLLNGGALEGLAITFFLLSVFFIIRSVWQQETTAKQKNKDILISILFANLSMYTHERYIVIIPCIILLILLAPQLKQFTIRQKSILISFAVLSMFLNVGIKNFVFSMPFFVGTGGTNMSFSFASAFGYLTDGILSIFQINKGPEYLTGSQFSALSTINKTIAITIFLSSLIVIGIFIFRSVKLIVQQKRINSDFVIFLFLGSLFFALLVPAIVTIRLEQRWLQASLCVFILMLILAFKTFSFRKASTKNLVSLLFVIAFMWIDFSYFYKGANNLYMKDAERTASKFVSAIENNLIESGVKKLYIWDEKSDINIQNGIIWSLGDGFIFKFYQSAPKKVVFVNSVYQKTDSIPVSSFVNFNPGEERIVVIDDKVIDITKYYLKDSLKSFNTDVQNKLATTDAVQYNQKQLFITNADFHKFTADGFHGNENGSSWTNGNASIGFKGNFVVTDTIILELNTYLPPICQNIKPKISIIDAEAKTYQPFYTKKEGDKFHYKFDMKNGTYLQKIQIVSDTIDSGVDLRVLSFPFISLEIKQ